MTTHISYKVSRALKELLGDSAPEPMGKEWYWWYENGVKSGPNKGKKVRGPKSYKYVEGDDDGELYVCLPAYQLHDLLSKPFCEAMAKKAKDGVFTAEEQSRLLWAFYYDGGLPAVEAELMLMMGKGETK